MDACCLVVVLARRRIKNTGRSDKGLISTTLYSQESTCVGVKTESPSSKENIKNCGQTQTDIEKYVISSGRRKIER